MFVNYIRNLLVKSYMKVKGLDPTYICIQILVERIFFSAGTCSGEVFINIYFKEISWVVITWLRILQLLVDVIVGDSLWG